MHQDKTKPGLNRPVLTFWIIGFFAFIWVLLRSGTNPKRLTYPCQQTLYPIASSWFIAVLALIGGSYILKKYARLTAGGLILVITGYFLAVFVDAGQGMGIAFFMPHNAKVHVNLPVWEVNNPVSKIFAINDIPPTSGSLSAGDTTVPNSHLSDPAMDTLFLMMESKGEYLHKTIAHPNGIAGPDDVVIIKGNFQWESRCGTNTDRIKGLIHQLLLHPNGFNGEILVCDNTQNLGSGINHQDNNSEDPNQSIIDVVNTFYTKGHKVYLLNWNTLYAIVADEYMQNDMNDGYVYEPSTKISYPKFRTPSGNHFISLRYGIWDTISSTYDHDKLVIIDFPVLKAHSAAGATIAIKNWVGVLTTAYNTERYGGFTQMHDDYFFGAYALIAQVMAVTYPKLSIVDAAWTNTYLENDLNTLVETECLLASTDPVALDWYASKFILTPIANYPLKTNPDNMGGTFNVNLTAWADYLKNTAGFPVTMDSNEISVYDRSALITTGLIHELPEDPGITLACYQNAEGNLKIRINAKKPQVVSVRILDLNGKVVATILEGKHVAEVIHLDCSTSGYCPGVYLVNLYNGKSNVTQKILIAR